LLWFHAGSGEASGDSGFASPHCDPRGVKGA